MYKSQHKLFYVLLIGFLVSFLLDTFVDINSCEYDACRFLKFNVDDLSYLMDSGDGIFGTYAMHFMYGIHDSSNWAFDNAFLVNILILIFSLPIIGLNSLIFGSALSISFLILPGKEFFLVLSIGYVSAFYNNWIVNKYSKAALSALIAILLIVLVRPGFLLLFSISGLLGYFWLSNKKVFFYSGLLTTLIFSVYVASLLGISEPSLSGGFDVESSIGAVNVIRDHTAGIYFDKILVRTFIYIGYLAFIPFIETYRLFNELITVGLYPYHVFLLAAVVEWVDCVILQKLTNILPIVFIASFAIASAYPFVHTRYLFPLFVFLRVFFYLANKKLTKV